MHAPDVAAQLTGEAFDVVAVATQPGLRGRPDEELLVFAASEERALVTENVADFIPIATAWTAEGRLHSGLIFTNPKRFNRSTLAYPGNLIAALREFLTEPPVTGDTWIWWL